MINKDIKNLVIDLLYVPSEKKWHYTATDKETARKYVGWIDLGDTAPKSLVNQKVVNKLKKTERQGALPGQDNTQGPKAAKQTRTPDLKKLRKEQDHRDEVHTQEWIESMIVEPKAENDEQD
jgi:hypothetical protein